MKLGLLLRKKSPYSELFLSVFSCIRAEYGEILSISPYSVRMRENTDQNNSEYGHFLRSVYLTCFKSVLHFLSILACILGHSFDTFFCSNYGRITQTLRIKRPSSEFFGTYCPAFEINTENHFENLRFQSNYEKIQTRETPKTDLFYAI